MKLDDQYFISNLYIMEQESEMRIAEAKEKEIASLGPSIEKWQLLAKVNFPELLWWNYHIVNS